MPKAITFCTVNDCSRRSHGSGLCLMHYKRVMKHGSTDEYKKPKITRLCKGDGCSNRHDSHGYCANHSRQFLKYGHTLSEKEISQMRAAQSMGRTHKGAIWSEQAKKERSEAFKGRNLNTGRTHFIKGVASWNKGLIGWATPEHKEKLRQARTGAVAWNKGMWGYRSGSLNPNWKGGVNSVNNALRRTKRYKNWRTEVFKRDDFTCQGCFVRGGYLEADHIKPFAFFPDLRFELNNGRTLCKECHMKTPTYKKHKYEEISR